VQHFYKIPSRSHSHIDLAAIAQAAEGRRVQVTSKSESTRACKPRILEIPRAMTKKQKLAGRFQTANNVYVAKKNMQKTP